MLLEKVTVMVVKMAWLQGCGNSGNVSEGGNDGDSDNFNDYNDVADIINGCDITKAIII